MPENDQAPRRDSITGMEIENPIMGNIFIYTPIQVLSYSQEKMYQLLPNPLKNAPFIHKQVIQRSMECIRAICKLEKTHPPFSAESIRRLFMALYQECEDVAS